MQRRHLMSKFAPAEIYTAIHGWHRLPLIASGDVDVQRIQRLAKVRGPLGSRIPCLIPRTQLEARNLPHFQLRSTRKLRSSCRPA